MKQTLYSIALEIIKAKDTGQLRIDEPAIDFLVPGHSYYVNIYDDEYILNIDSENTYSAVPPVAYVPYTDTDDIELGSRVFRITDNAIGYITARSSNGVQVVFLDASEEETNNNIVRLTYQKALETLKQMSGKPFGVLHE